MNLLNSIIFGSLSTLAASHIIENEMKNYDTDVQPPIDTVSIIMSAYNEEDFIEKAALSIRNQSIIKAHPEYFEFIIVDNDSTDKTSELANQLADKVSKAPRGKLNAKNHGINLSRNNIIVTTDADVFYPQHWLNTLLKPLRDPNIIGISGTLLDYSFPNIPTTLFVIMSLAIRTIYPLQMYGGNCAFYKHIFYRMGMFNENINQFDANEMMNEEEFDFGKKLSKFGNVVYKINAPCVHLGGLRTACRIGFKNKYSKECAKYNIGKERF